MNKITTATFLKMKNNKDKITMLTAYDYSTAKLFDEGGIDCILVGDSLGMVVLGYDDTTSVTMEDMLHHTRAVSRAAKNAMVVADMPFLSYHTGINDAVINAGRLIREAGAGCVKLEGGSEVVAEIKAILRAGIPIMGHIGLTPQSVNKLGGYFYQGKTDDAAERLVQDALALQDAGVFAIVLECVPAELARKISNKLSIPTIGIGAGAGCDGQVLVCYDMLGIYKKELSFVKKYADLGSEIKTAVNKYIDEVKKGEFPSSQYTTF